MFDQPLTSALEFTFRAATPDDASFIARYVLAAFHIIELDQPLSEEQQQSITALEPVVQQEGVLYSYRHAEIVEIKGEPIAMLLSYKGPRISCAHLPTTSFFHRRRTRIDG